MEPVAWGFIGTLVGAIVGASASIITTTITERNSRILQQDASSIERKEKSREFQRSNLLDLQEALSHGMRLVTRAHLESIRYFRSHGEDGQLPLLTEELDQELLISNRTLAILSERIADDLLREGIKKLRREMTNAVMARSETESDAALERASFMFGETMEDLGVVLRNSY